LCSIFFLLQQSNFRLYNKNHPKQKEKMRPINVILALAIIATALTFVFSTSTNNAPIKTNESLCSGCKFLITVVESFIAQNSTIGFIEKEIKLVCPYLQREYRDVCPLLIDQMAPEIVQVLLTRENPEVVCKMIGLCSAATTTDIAVETNVQQQQRRPRKIMPKNLRN
jgi:hypothetical protein